jgi:hypothetical protein
LCFRLNEELQDDSSGCTICALEWDVVHHDFG